VKFFGGRPGWRRTVATVAALAVFTGVPVTFAVLHNGFPVSDVKLNVKDVWVTNDQMALAGRLNRQINELTAGTDATSSSFDVVQAGAQVFLHDEQGDTLQRIVRSSTLLVEKTAVPADAQVSLGGTIMSVLNPSNGKLWVVNVANGLSFDETAAPTIKLGAHAQAVVSKSGIVYATSPSQSKLYTVTGAGALPTSKQLSIPADNQLSVVGETPVMLDAKKSILITGDGKRIALHAKALRIQQPSEANTSALVATSTSLLQVPLAGGSPKAILANIPPQASAADASAPVYLDGCSYAAWAGAERYLQQCGDGVVTRVPLGVPTQGSHLEFRVNQHVIALNNLQNGNTWVLTSKLILVKNWDKVRPPVQSKVTKGHQKSIEDSFEDTLAQRTKVNHPPVARPDTYGIRPGRTTILPVADNDTDPDGDILVITHVAGLDPSYGKVDEIDGGRALQFTPAASPSGGGFFNYTISDGRGLSDSATVNLSIVPAALDHAPKSLRNPSVSVEAGQTVTYNVLTDWTDPDGDDLQLSAASATSADIVRFTPDGFITFQNHSGQTGTLKVNYTVTDGKMPSSGTLSVVVKSSGSLKPVGTPDFAQIFTGQTTVIQPLLNDIAPNGKPLSLVSVDNAPSTATVITNLAGKTVSVSSLTPGVIYLTYHLGAGDERGLGIMRIDVVAVPKKILAPIAVKDVAYLRAGQSTTEKVLNNDVSPDGKVLSVQSVNTDHTAQGVSVELLNNTVVRITASNGLTSQTQFTYTISDGQLTATAGVTIIPVAPLVTRQPPIAVAQTRVVRAGDIASVAVLNLDYSPDQEQIYLDPVLPDTTGTGGGLAFVNGSTIRYQAPAKPGQYSLTYRIHDQYGESANGRLTFVVTAIDKVSDRAPAPAIQTARDFAGQTVRINVPLDNIDPDGDSSFLTGVALPPHLGTITNSGQTWFDYKADADQAGTDNFKYTVADTFGKVGTGEIDVGVIPHAAIRADPVAVPDSIEVKPGKTISTQVMANDSDPNGYPLTLSHTLSNVSPALTAHVTGTAVIIHAPTKQGEFTLRYSISNGQGGTASAFITVKVTKDAVAVYPVATDDYILNSQLHGTSAIKVNIESLIQNPNGETSALLISAAGPNAERADIDQANGTIKVVPEDKRYAVAYRVTDPSNSALTATAFIVVPPVSRGTNTLAPSLKTTLPLQVVKENSFRVWKLNEILNVPSGKSVTIVSASTVVATHSDNSSVYVDPHTLKFTAQKNYVGSANIVFQVTDGATESFPHGRLTYIRLPITIVGTKKVELPPTFTVLKLQVQAGEAATTVDLRESTADANSNVVSQVRYSGLTGQTASVIAQLSNSSLSVSVPLGVQPGTTATLDFSLTYKQFTVPGQVQVTVVKSTRPLTQANPDVAKGQRSQSISYNVLANDFNPYADENKPLTLTAATLQDPASTSAVVTFTPDGVVTVVPDASFIGAIGIIYTVRDASDDPSRDVQGSYTLSVRDVPNAPAPPTIDSQDDHSVTVGWQPPGDNGEAIISYTISTSGGIQPVTVPATAAETTIKGLTNGNNYTFSITAENALGNSASSGNSATAIPFGLPGAPGTPSISASTSGDGGLSLSWGSANGNGRSVSNYTWRLSDGQTGTTSSLTASPTGHVGTAYSFTVVANNPAGAGPSSSSGNATPTPGAPRDAFAVSGAAGDQNVRLSWGASPSTEPISKYEININGGGWIDEGTIQSVVVTGQYGQGTNYIVRGYSAGQVSDTTQSNTATPQPPPAPPAPSYALCYGAAYQGGSQHFVGVNYANVVGSVTLKLQGNFTSHTTVVGGDGKWVSQSRISRGTANDLNQIVTLLGNGSPVLSERWGDAPPC
jgi:hypothetical protein